MLEVRKFDSFEDGREVCCIRCGGSADAVIDAGLMKFGLCEGCLDLVAAEITGLQWELKRSCLYCRHWQRPDDYKRYDGHCLLHQRDAEYLGSCDDFETRNT